jgi:hypothetical protein
MSDGSLTRALSRYNSEHQEAWQGSILTAQATLASLTPDILRAFQKNDIDLLEELQARLKQVLSDRKKLLNKK